MRHRLERFTSCLTPHPKGRHRRSPTSPVAPVSARQAPRRTPIAINDDALPMVRPYVAVAEARRNGAAAW
jgi:hypothetical protein